MTVQRPFIKSVSVRCHLGAKVLALWVSVALLSNGYLESEVSSAVAWTVGGILLNLDVIHRDQTVG